MSKQPLLNESTQRRMLLLAGMSQYADEVIAESKKENGIPSAPDYVGGIKKGEKEGKKSPDKESCDDETKKLLEELPKDEFSPAPSAPPSAPAPAPETNPAPALDTGDLELKTFAQEFAKFLSAQGHQIVMTVDGEDMATTDADLATGEEADFGETEPQEEPEGLDTSAQETDKQSTEEEEEKNKPPQFESKEKRVAKLVYEEVLKTLAANAGINLTQAQKNGSVQLKMTGKAKKAVK